MYFARLTRSGSYFFALTALLFLVGAVARNTDKQDTNAPGHLYSRTTYDLSGNWRFMQDQLDNAVPNGQVINAKQRYTFWENDLQQTPGPLIEYEWDQQVQIKVPGDWNTQANEYLFYEGTGWYQHTFVNPIKPNKRYFLYFEGANYRTRAWLNKQEVGATHYGGYTPFAYEVTDKISSNDNLLVVSVNNERTLDGVPARSSDWWNYGGITRPVRIVEVPQTYIHRFNVSLTDYRTGRIVGEVILDGPDAANTRVELRIDELGIRQSLSTDSAGRGKIDVIAPSLKLWSNESPKRYQVTVTSAQDSVTEAIGFRIIETRGADILLNGKSLFLAGISIHEEPIGPVGGRLVDRHQARALLEESKALGANFVRLAHYPHNEHMVRLADEMGLLVWSELPVYWGIAFDNPETLANAKAQMQANMLRDFNRASIVIWSVANETKPTDDRNAFLQSVIAHVRALDSSRLVSAALLKSKGQTDNEITVDDPLSDYLDVISVNEYEGWYGKRNLDQISELSWDLPDDKPLLFSEFGAGAMYGYRDEDNVRWSEDYQDKFYRETVNMIDKIPSLRGASPWILKDFKSHRRYHGRFQNFWNRKGLIAETGERKQAFYTLRDYYLEKRNLKKRNLKKQAEF